MRSFLRRGWWRPWNWSTRTWLVAIVLSVCMSPFVTRWVCLWQVPDVALPFEINEIIGVDIPKDENAFVRYESITQTLAKTPTSWLDSAVEQSILSFDSKWDDRLDQWLIDHASLLADFERASQMERASWMPGVWHINAHISPLLYLRKLARLSQAEAIRCERAGDLEEAWKWHRAALRSANHAESPQVSMGVASARVIRVNDFTGISRWAAYPSLTVERLRSARMEIAKDVSSHRTKMSDTLRVEYVMLKNTMDQEYAPDFLYPQWVTSSQYERLFSIGKRFYLWTIGQPELSLRLSRQVLVNNWDQIDLRRQQHRLKPLRSEYPMVFERDSGKRRAPGQLDAAQLVCALQSPLGQRLIQIEFFTSFGPRKADLFDMDVVFRSFDANVAMIDMVLAAHEFQRTHGEFPATIQQLVPEFLDAVPFDPMSDIGAPLNYRRDASGEAIIWSLGFNQTDENGDIDLPGQKDQGFRIRLHPRQRNESLESQPIEK